MKDLKQYIREKLVIFHPQVDEKLIVNKNYKNTYTPNTWDELRQIIEQRYKEEGVGLKGYPINFNDIDVSEIDTFTNNNHVGVFSNTQFEYIDVSEWNVSNITDMTNLFSECKYLRSPGNLSKWDVSNVTNFTNMFNECHELRSIGNISKWNVSNAEDISGMFMGCMSLRSVGDLSKWDVSNVKYTKFMFYDCEKLKSVGDLSNWNISNIKNTYNMFFDSAIKKSDRPSWYKG